MRRQNNWFWISEFQKINKQLSCPFSMSGILQSEIWERYGTGPDLLIGNKFSLHKRELEHKSLQATRRMMKSTHQRPAFHCNRQNHLQ